MFIGEDSYDNMIKAISKKRFAQQNQDRFKERSINIDPNEVYNDVDQSAEFPGGIAAFRKIITDQISESSSVGNDGIVKTEITFIVEIDGLISNIKANGENVKFNSTVEQVVTLIKKKWAPAKINGKSVRSYFRLPLTYNFEN
jgi:protein TonB